MGVTPPSSWPGVGHVVSRLPPPTSRPFETRFPFGSAAKPLNLAGDDKSPDHYAKGTPSPFVQDEPWTKRAPTACRHVVSGSLSSPYRGSSHLSLALLGSLSVAREYLALGDGPPRFRLASTCRVLLRCRIESLPRSRTGLSPALVRLSRRFRLGTNSLNTGPTTPRGQALLVWAIPRSLAATDGVAVAFSSWGY